MHNMCVFCLAHSYTDRFIKYTLQMHCFIRLILRKLLVHLVRRGATDSWLTAVYTPKVERVSTISYMWLVHFTAIPLDEHLDCTLPWPKERICFVQYNSLENINKSTAARFGGKFYVKIEKRSVGLCGCVCVCGVLWGKSVESTRLHTQATTTTNKTTIGIA